MLHRGAEAYKKGGGGIPYPTPSQCNLLGQAGSTSYPGPVLNSFQTWSCNPVELSSVFTTARFIAYFIQTGTCLCTYNLQCQNTYQKCLSKSRTVYNLLSCDCAIALLDLINIVKVWRSLICHLKI
jgi:hypothetical protein